VWTRYDVTVDTDFLFRETYALIEQIEQKYGIQERVRSLLTPEEQARDYGEALWTRDPDRCCALRICPQAGMGGQVSLGEAEPPGGLVVAAGLDLKPTSPGPL